MNFTLKGLNDSFSKYNILINRYKRGSLSVFIINVIN